MDNKSLLQSKHRKHRRQTFYGKIESRNSQSRRKIWKSPVVNEIRQQGYVQRILQQTAKR